MVDLGGGGVMKSQKRTYAIFIWHGFFLALTQATLDLNTVFPALVTTLVDSKTVFGLLYSIMLGVPFVFNIVFGHYLQDKPRKKPYLLLAIYLRVASFLGIATFTFLFGGTAPLVVLVSLFVWIFLLHMITIIYITLIFISYNKTQYYK